jgi:hypothetical protein
MQQEKAGLRANRYADFIGYFKAAATFEMFFPKENLNVT